MKAAIIGAVIFCAALIGVGTYFATREDTGGPRLMPIDAQYTTRTTQGFWAKGADKPTVTVVEYADYQCPYCQALYSGMNQAIDETASYVQLQYHNYPLYANHNKSRLAAEAAESAGRQGKFWEMHDLLYARQSAWADQTPFSFQSTLEQYAKDLQLNVDQFKKDLKDTTIQDQIDKDVALGDKVPVEGTPTITINGKKVDKPPYAKEDLVKLFEAAKNGQ
jgi:protein-disulfide isomerase